MRLYADSAKCSGCRACLVACSLNIFQESNPKKASLNLIPHFPAPGGSFLFQGKDHLESCSWNNPGDQWSRASIPVIGIISSSWSIIIHYITPCTVSAGLKKRFWKIFRGVYFSAPRILAWARRRMRLACWPTWSRAMWCSATTAVMGTSWLTEAIRVRSWLS